MRSLVERLLREVAEFVEQREDFILLAASSSDDSATLLAAMRNVEDSLGSDVFLLFPDDFEQGARYASALVERVAAEVKLANQALAEEGGEPFGEVPQALRDTNRPPADRLREAMLFSRSLVPREDGHRVVWGMCPGQIRDRSSYRELIAALSPARGLQPWMTGLRLIFRDELADSADALARAPGVRRRAFDFGPKAMEESLRRESDDGSRPEADRMQSLLSVALLDYAHERYQEATSKFMRLLGYFQRVKDLGMQAFVVNAVGDVYHRTGSLPKAQEWYERALTPAAEAKQPVILATIVRNLADVAFELKAWAPAEQYYGQLDRLAAHLLDPEGKIRAMERRGLCLEKLGSLAKAAESWEDAAKLSRSIGLPAFLKAVLEHLERAYRSLRSDKNLEAVQSELRALARTPMAS